MRRAYASPFEGPVVENTAGKVISKPLTLPVAEDVGGKIGAQPADPNPFAQQAACVRHLGQEAAVLFIGAVGGGRGRSVTERLET